METKSTTVTKLVHTIMIDMIASDREKAALWRIGNCEGQIQNTLKLTMNNADLTARISRSSRKIIECFNNPLSSQFVMSCRF